MKESLRGYSKSMRCKFASLFALVCFSLSVLICPGTVSANISSMPLTGIEFSPNNSIVQSAFKAESPEPLQVIHLQDAHANYEAQKNISAILHDLDEKYDIDSVFVEGAEGDYNLSLFRAFPFKDKDKVFDKYVRDGRLSGAEEYAIISDDEVDLCGVDNEDIYIKNIETYLAADKLKDEGQVYCSVLRQMLESVREEVLTPELLEFVEKKEVFESSGMTNPLDYTRALTAKVDELGISTRWFKEFERLRKLDLFQKKINTDEIAAETDALVNNALIPVLNEADSAKLAFAEIDFRGGRLSPYKYYSLLRILAANNDIDFREYKNLTFYVNYLSLVDGLDAALLLKERKQIEEKIIDRLTKNSIEKDIISKAEEISILKNIVSLQAVPDDIAFFDKYENKLTTAEFTRFFARHGRQLPQQNFSIEKALPVYKKFYELARAREDAFVEKTIRRMKQANLKTAVLMTGGFHTDGIEKRLKDKGISFVTVAPRLSKLPKGNLYEKLMRSYDKYFGVREGTRGGTVQNMRAAKVLDAGVNKPLYQEFLQDLVDDYGELVKGLGEDVTLKKIREWNEKTDSHVLVLGNNKKFYLLPREKAVSAVKEIKDDQKLVQFVDASNELGADYRPAWLQKADKRISFLEKKIAEKNARLQEFKKNYEEVKKEKSVPGSGDLPEYAVFSDNHGAIDVLFRYIEYLIEMDTGRKVKLDDELYPQKSIRQMLADQDFDPQDFKKGLYFLGDLGDRGPHGLKCFLAWREMVSIGWAEGKFLPGNHDELIYFGATGRFLPISDSYRTHGKEKSARLIEEHKNDRKIVQDAFGFYMDKLVSFEEKRAALEENLTVQMQGKACTLKEVRSRYVKVYEAWDKNGSLTGDRRAILGELVGRFFGKVNVYTGFKAAGRMSVERWQEYYDKVVSFSKDAEPGSEEQEFWAELLDIVKEVKDAFNLQFQKELGRGDWWAQIFNDLNDGTYRTLEWYSKDWVFHKGWGEAVIKKELNSYKSFPDWLQDDLAEFMPDDYESTVWTQRNFYKHPLIKLFAQFSKETFGLYLEDGYGSLMTHSPFPKDKKTGAVYVENHGTRTPYNNGIGANFLTVLDEITDKMRDPDTTEEEMVELSALYMSWYADKTVSIKPEHEAAALDKHGVAVPNKSIGKYLWFHCHNPINKLRDEVGIEPKEQDGLYAQFAVDKGMSYMKYKDVGGFWLAGPNGMQLLGFSGPDMNEIVKNPDVYKLDKEKDEKTGKEYLKINVDKKWSSESLSRDDFLNAAEMQLEDTIEVYEDTINRLEDELNDLVSFDNAAGFISNGEKSISVFDNSIRHDLKRATMFDFGKIGNNVAYAYERIKEYVYDINGPAYVHTFLFDSIVSSAEDFFLGTAERDEAGHNVSVYLAEDLVDLTAKLSQKHGLSLLDEYLQHEILCMVHGHRKAIELQKKQFPSHYDPENKDIKRLLSDLGMESIGDEFIRKNGAFGVVLRYLIDKKTAEQVAELIFEEAIRKDVSKFESIWEEIKDFAWEMVTQKTETPEQQRNVIKVLERLATHFYTNEKFRKVDSVFDEAPRVASFMDIKYVESILADPANVSVHELYSNNERVFITVGDGYSEAEIKEIRKRFSELSGLSVEGDIAVIKMNTKVSENAADFSFLRDRVAEYDVVNIFCDDKVVADSTLQENAYSNLSNLKDISILNKFRVVKGAADKTLPMGSALSIVEKVFEPESTIDAPVFTKKAKKVLAFFGADENEMAGLLAKGTFIAEVIKTTIAEKVKQAIHIQKISIYA